MLLEQKKRNEIEDKYKWNVSDLYSDDKAWQNDYDLVSSEIGNFIKYQGKLSDMPTLLECLIENNKACKMAERIYVYANMKLHEDSNESFYQGLSDKAESLVVKLTSALSFIEPEILTIDINLITYYMQENKEFELYRHFIEDLIRQKEHVLSQELEVLLAEASEIGQAADNIYSMINNADIRFGKVLDDDGNEVEITQGRYTSLLESKKVSVRENVFKTYYKSYLSQKNTLAATYNASVKKDVFFSKSRKYKSSLDAALSGYNIPHEVYTNLISTVRNNLSLMHRYVKLRKEFLKLPELHMYDLYTPMISEVDTKITYEESKKKVLEALKPLGEEYIKIVEKSFNEGWIDVYENEGKRSGAYSWGAYGCHPYVLLNFDNKINDMFTLAHEIGHAMHSHYTWSTQPYAYGDYTIFVAEVASTVNEALLMDYLLKTTTDKTQRKYLINYYMEQFRGTLFRQTMFAEFEMRTHEMVENGEPLTVASLSDLYRNLNESYYGKDIIIDEEVNIEWSRIPHFYSAFYVYQYATGISAAVSLAKGILSGDKTKIENYLEFLKSGGSDYSINLLKKAGVDMTSPKPIEDALLVFEGLVNEMESLL